MKVRVLIAAAALAAPIVSSGLGALAAGAASQPAQVRGLTVRSLALDRRYHLGSYRPIGRGVVAPGKHPDWLRALDLRSIGLDRKYHLGSFARTS